jgi:hypothetical protein
MIIIRKLATRWVSKMNTVEHIRARKSICAGLLQRSEVETLFCHELPVKKPVFIITTHWKIQSMEWHHQASPRKNKFKVQTSADTVFWDSKGSLLMEF